MVHLGIQRALGKRLLQCIKQTALLKYRTGGTAGKQLVQKLIGYRWFFAS